MALSREKDPQAMNLWVNGLMGLAYSVNL
jgi:hypothetical protein